MTEFCIDCKHYHEIEKSGFPDERIFPGRGECWYKPPVSLMDPAGRVITARPEVLGIETCGRYTPTEAVRAKELFKRNADSMPKTDDTVSKISRQDEKSL